MKRVAVAVIFLAVLGVVAHHKALSGSGDFDTYYVAAGDALAGRPLYRETGAGPYLYPPLFAVLLAPLSRVPYPVAHALWFLLNAALFAFMLRFAESLLPAPPRSKAVAWLARGALAFACVTLADNLSMAQANVVVAALVAAGFMAWTSGRPFAAGLALSLAAALKVSPALFLLFFLVRREGRVLAGWAAGFALWLLLVPSLVLGLGRNAEYLSAWSEKTIGGYSRAVSRDAWRDEAVSRAKMQNLLNAKNQSLAAVFYRLLLSDLRERAYDEKKPIYAAQRYRIFFPIKLPEPGVRAAIVSAAAALLGATLWVSARARGKEAWTAFALILALVPALSPVARSHTFAPLVLAAFLLPALLHGTRGTRRSWTIALGTAAIAAYALLAVPALQAHGAGFVFLILLWGALFSARNGLTVAADTAVKREELGERLQHP